MRNTDPAWDTTKHVPLGAPLTPKTPSAPAPKPQQTGPSGIVTDEQGRLRTTTHPR